MIGKLVVGGIGATVGIEVLAGDLGQAADEQLLARLTQLWQRELLPEQSQCQVKLQIKLGFASGEIIADPIQERLLNLVTRAVTFALIGLQKGELLLFHAGAVAHPKTGNSLVFIASSGTGKTTLARELGKEYGYLTDETVGINAAGLILAYQKPLSILQPDGTKLETSPVELGLKPAPGRPKVTRVILLSREPETVSPTVEPLSTLDAITAAAPETSGLAELPAALHQISQLLHSTGGAQRWRYAQSEMLWPLVKAELGNPC